MGALLTNLLGGKLLDGVNGVIDRIKGSNPEDAAKLKELVETHNAEFRAAELAQQNAQLQAAVTEAQGQVEINKIEAASGNRFDSGWRPFVGWALGAGVATDLVIGPWATFFCRLAGHDITFPKLDTPTLLALLVPMLGLGIARTVEKLRGVAKQ
jgi:hypothetical protein